MNTEELIKQIRDLENFWEITPREDMFGVGWNHAKDKIIELIEEMDKPRPMDLLDQLNVRKSGY